MRIFFWFRRLSFFNRAGVRCNKALIIQLNNLWLALTLLIFTSCEKVIDINLNSAQKKYVIEGVISDEAGSCKVLLTQTKDFSENNTFDGVSGAIVTISDNGATPVNLIEAGAGLYTAPNLIAKTGHTYSLRVQVNTQTFTATSTMPPLVPFDSLKITERNLFGNVNKYAAVFYADPPGVPNQYRFVQYVNGVKEKTIFVRNDDFNDGRSTERTLVYFRNGGDKNDDSKLKPGDVVTVEMRCISQPVYKYWYSLAESSTGENQSATPGNPLTNISGGALGYFSAETFESRTITVPE